MRSGVAMTGRAGQGRSCSLIDRAWVRRATCRWFCAGADRSLGTGAEGASCGATCLCRCQDALNLPSLLSQRPTISGAVKGVIAEGYGWKGFFRGVGPRALSNGINSAVFFCFFEAIRKVGEAQRESTQARGVATEGRVPLR